MYALFEGETKTSSAQCPRCRAASVTRHAIHVAVWKRTNWQESTLSEVWHDIIYSKGIRARLRPLCVESL